MWYHFAKTETKNYRISFSFRMHSLTPKNASKIASLTIQCSSVVVFFSHSHRVLESQIWWEYEHIHTPIQLMIRLVVCWSTKRNARVAVICLLDISCIGRSLHALETSNRLCTFHCDKFAVLAHSLRSIQIVQLFQSFQWTRTI